MKQQPGYISTQLHRATGGSCMFMNYAVWESVAHFRAAFTHQDFMNALPWTGDETVLDIGCGRGLMLVGAARRLTTGQAVGIDLWRTEDQADNSPEAAQAHARREGFPTRYESTRATRANFHTWTAASTRCSRTGWFTTYRMQITATRRWMKC
jgi:2-polyprenyl-3-methyl-5-hydroxy-6-metoxy-1,4-benzoquinol methylase